MSGSLEFDIWLSDSGSIIATRSTERFVYDLNVPYGYDTHVVRVKEKSVWLAIRDYHKLKKI